MKQFIQDIVDAIVALGLSVQDKSYLRNISWISNKIRININNTKHLARIVKIPYYDSYHLTPDEIIVWLYVPNLSNFKEIQYMQLVNDHELELRMTVVNNKVDLKYTKRDLQHLIQEIVDDIRSHQFVVLDQTISILPGIDHAYVHIQISRHNTSRLLSNIRYFESYQVLLHCLSIKLLITDDYMQTKEYQFNALADHNIYFKVKIFNHVVSNIEIYYHENHNQ